LRFSREPQGGYSSRGRVTVAARADLTIPFAGVETPAKSSLKEVIQPHLPVRLPCYDFTPLAGHTLGTAVPVRVQQVASGAPDSSGVTGGVYKAREHIHRGMLTRGY
jgi:hypothetical protein